MQIINQPQQQKQQQKEFQYFNFENFSNPLFNTTTTNTPQQQFGFNSIVQQQ